MSVIDTLLLSVSFRPIFVDFAFVFNMQPCRRQFLFYCYCHRVLRVFRACFPQSSNDLTSKKYRLRALKYNGSVGNYTILNVFLLAICQLYRRATFLKTSLCGKVIAKIEFTTLPQSDFFAIRLSAVNIIAKNGLARKLPIKCERDFFFK